MDSIPILELLEIYPGNYIHTICYFEYIFLDSDWS